MEALELGEIESGSGLNQEMGLSRPGDTRWGSHLKTILHIVDMYSTILEVLGWETIDVYVPPPFL